MRAVGPGVEQGDRDRLDSLFDKMVDRPDRTRLVQGSQDFPMRAHALGNADPECPLHQWHRLHIEKVVQLRKAQSAELQHVAKALRGKQARSSPGALED